MAKWTEISRKHFFTKHISSFTNIQILDKIFYFLTCWHGAKWKLTSTCDNLKDLLGGRFQSHPQDLSDIQNSGQRRRFLAHAAKYSMNRGLFCHVIHTRVSSSLHFSGIKYEWSMDTKFDPRKSIAKKKIRFVSCNKILQINGAFCGMST